MSEHLVARSMTHEKRGLSYSYSKVHAAATVKYVCGWDKDRIGAAAAAGNKLTAHFN